MPSPVAASPAHPNPALAGGRVPSLDGLRGIGVIAVLLAHACTAPGFPWAKQQHWFDAVGRNSLMMFFLISGYIITSLILRERQNTGSVSLSAFYFRRAIRILPASYVFITAAMLFYHPGRKWALWSYAYLMSYASKKPHVFAHLWTLSVEEQFYLLWPLAMVFLFRRAKAIGWAVMVIAPVARLVCLHYGWHNLKFYFPCVMDALAIGCLLALYYPEVKAKFSWLLKPLPTTLLLLVTVANCVYFNNTIATRGQAALLGIQLVLITLCVFVAIEKKPRVLNNPVASYLGDLSYSVYLWQMFFYPAERYWWSTWPVNLLLIYVVSAASYALVDKQAAKLRRFAPDVRRRQAMVKAAAATS